MPKKIITQAEKYEVKIPKVNNPRDFHGGNIAFFTGDTYEDSLQKAYDWQNSNPQVELVDYFAQTAFNKSILVSYNISEQKGKQNEQKN